MVIKFTSHAKVKVAERKITLALIREAVKSPDRKEKDKFDEDLVHFIKKVGTKFLRVIGRWENKDVFVVISVFYDRRLKRRKKSD